MSDYPSLAVLPTLGVILVVLAVIVSRRRSWSSDLAVLTLFFGVACLVLAAGLGGFFVWGSPS